MDNMPPTYPPTYSTHSVYPPNTTPSTSIALFHIPQDATNSIYIDGIPNDASEREVSRKRGIIQMFFVPFQVFSKSDSFAKPLWAADSISYASLILKMYFKLPSH